MVQDGANAKLTRPVKMLFTKGLVIAVHSVVRIKVFANPVEPPVVAYLISACHPA